MSVCVCSNIVYIYIQYIHICIYIYIPITQKGVIEKSIKQIYLSL